MFTEPSLQKVENFLVTGLSVRTKNSDEFNPETAKIPELWQQFYQSELATTSKIYGVYSHYESDANGPYRLTVGVPSSVAPANFSSTVAIQAGNYLVFQGVGPMPFTVIETWKYVWNFFEKNTQFQRHYQCDFEVYDGLERVEIYIGLR